MPIVRRTDCVPLPMVVCHVVAVVMLESRVASCVRCVYVCFYGFIQHVPLHGNTTRVGTLIVATIYLQLIQNRYMFRSLTVLHCSHQHCVQPVASDVEVVGYL